MTETRTGGCLCGAVRSEVAWPLSRVVVCHCTDCRRSSGAPAVGFALFPDDRITITGTPTAYESSPGVIREFCGTCGTNLFYRNEAIFPGQLDLHTATLDDPDALPPSIRIQVADAPEWFGRFDALPAFPRYPG